MKHLKRRGRNWALPLEGKMVKGLSVGCSFRIITQVREYLYFETEFSLKLYNDEFNSKNNEVYVSKHFVKLLEQEIVEALAYSTGELFLRFKNGYEIFVEDGPYENWQYLGPDFYSVSGGVGRIVEC